MNPNTSHLKRLHEEGDRENGYEPVPEWLEDEAQQELNGKDETFVDPESNTRLANYMNRLRRKRKKKNKISKASRRKNR